MGPRDGLNGCGISRLYRASISVPSSPERIAVPTETSRPTDDLGQVVIYKKIRGCEANGSCYSNVLNHGNVSTIRTTVGLSLSQIIQLGAQFCLNIFIYVPSLYVSGIQVPIIRRKSMYLCDTAICHSVWVASGRLVKQMPEATDPE